MLWLRREVPLIVPGVLPHVCPPGSGTSLVGMPVRRIISTSVSGLLYRLLMHSALAGSAHRRKFAARIQSEVAVVRERFEIVSAALT
jgi:hypothetical protein